MKRGLLITGIVLLTIAAAAGGAYWWLSRPVELQAFDEPGASAEVKQRNADTQTALLGDGVTSSLVDINAERAYLAYDAPAPAEGEAFDAADLQEEMLFALAESAPESPRAILVMYVDGEAKHIWKADLTALRAIPEEDDGTALEAYLATIERIEL